MWRQQKVVLVPAMFALVLIVFGAVLLPRQLQVSSYGTRPQFTIINDGYYEQEPAPDGRNGGDTLPQDMTRDSDCDSTYRTRWIQEVCDGHNWTASAPDGPSTDKMLYVDDKHKVVYCAMWKAGCSTMKTLMVASSGEKDLANITAYDWRQVGRRDFQLAHGLQRMDTMTKEEQMYRLQNYFKFMVVRHPLDRLYTAYKYAISEGPGPDILDNHKKFIIQNDTKNENLYKNDTFVGDFNDFARFVVNDSWFSNKHWQDYNSICNPCGIQYDSIVRLETFEQDMPLILDKLPGPNGITYAIPQVNMGRTESVAHKFKRLKGIYEKVDRSTLNGLLALYSKDLTLFGYGVDTDSLVPTCRYTGINVNGRETHLKHCC